MVFTLCPKKNRLFVKDQVKAFFSVIYCTHKSFKIKPRPKKINSSVLKTAKQLIFWRIKFGSLTNFKIKSEANIF